jgi:hypothetical protein
MTSDKLLGVFGLAALAVLAGCSGASGPDVLIQRDNRELRGELQSCTADVCMLNSKPIARSSIAWIGLRRQPPPPQAQNATSDEVHLSDSSVQFGKLLTINSTNVITDKGVFSRTQVEWIHLGGAETGEEHKNNEGNLSDESAKSCPADRPLGGRVKLDYVTRFSPHFYVGPAESQNRILLWFPLVPAYKPYVFQNKVVETSRTARYELAASVLNYEISTSGYTSSYKDSDCKVPAQSRNGSIQFGDYDASHTHPGLRFIRFRALYPDLTIQGPKEIDAPWPDQGICRDRAHPDKTYQATAPSIMSDLDIGPESCGTLPNNFCTNAGYCSLGHTIADPSVMRECLARPEKYTVIPFAGSGTHSGEFDDFPSVQVKWEVCCGCGTKPETGPAPDKGENR